VSAPASAAAHASTPVTRRDADHRTRFTPL
jgi:hypothetical protein